MKKNERYTFLTIVQTSSMASGLHVFIVSDNEFPIYTYSFQGAFYGPLQRLFYLCLFIVSGISWYKSYRKSNLEALKAFSLKSLVDRPSWNWGVLAHDYVAYFCSDVLLRIRVCESLINSVPVVS